MLNSKLSSGKNGMPAIKEAFSNFLEPCTISHGERFAKNRGLSDFGFVFLRISFPPLMCRFDDLCDKSNNAILRLIDLKS